MNRYEGLIIGGHHDGQRMKSDRPVVDMQIPLLVTIEPIPSDIPGPDGFVTSKETYKHQMFQFRNDNTGEYWSFGFWVPVDCKSPQPFIMQNLVAGYR